MFADIDYQIDGTVTATALSGRILYIAGPFTSVLGSARAGFAAIDLETDSVTALEIPFAGNPPSSTVVINRLLIHDNYLYIAGHFIILPWEGDYHRDLCRINLATGLEDSWRPDPGGEVYDIVASANTLFAIGKFAYLGDTAFANTASFLFASMGTPETWGRTVWHPLALSGFGHSPSTLGRCALAHADGIVYITGRNFSYVGSTVGGVFRAGFAAVSDSGVGAATSLNPGLYADPFFFYQAYRMIVHNGILYLGGQWIHSFGGQARSCFAALDLSTGLVTDWNPFDPNNKYLFVRDFGVEDGILYLVGAINYADGIYRQGGAAFDIASHVLTGWNPDVNMPVHRWESCEGNIYLAGEFTTFQSRNPRERLALYVTPPDPPPEEAHGIVTVAIQYFPGHADGIATASDTVLNPTYRWWLGGELVQTTKSNVFYFHVEPGEDLELAVFDDDTIPAASFPAKDRFQWPHADGSDYYEASEYVGSAWVTRAIIRDIGQWIFAWKTRPLEDCTLHQFRVRSMGLYSNGEYKTFSAYMIRNPDHPTYTPSIDPDTGALTFA